jgi:hypothetical protein
MAKLVEDSRVMTFAQDSEVPHDTYLNEIQDQLRGTHKTLQVCIDSHAFDEHDAGTGWHYDTSNKYFETTAVGQTMFVGVPLREGQKITQVDISLYGSTTGASGAGAIYLKKRQLITGTGNASLNAASSVQQIGGSTPWSTNSLWDRITVSGLSYVIDTDYSYFFEITGPTAGAYTARWADFIVTAQFGN